VLLKRLKTVKVVAKLIGVMLAFSHMPMTFFAYRPTVMSLQTMVTICEKELQELDMQINASKSACIRMDRRGKPPSVILKHVTGQLLHGKMI